MTDITCQIFQVLSKQIKFVEFCSYLTKHLFCDVMIMFISCIFFYMVDNESKMVFLFSVCISNMFVFRILTQRKNFCRQLRVTWHNCVQKM